MQNPYVYVVVRTDLSVPQQAVQGGHALLEMSRTAWSQPKEHPSTIWLGVKNEAELLKLAAELTIKTRIQFTVFREPDIGSSATALATEYIYGSDRSFFRKLSKIDGTTTAKPGSY